MEQIEGVPVPHIWEPIVDGLEFVPQESVQNRPRDLFVDMRVTYIKEEIVDGATVLPQECVQNRATYTGKVFTVKMPHHRVDQACAVDNVGFIKGLDKHNMARLGDVMVPVLDFGGLEQGIARETPEEKVVVSGSRTQLCRQLVVLLMVLVFEASSQDRVQQRLLELISSVFKASSHVNELGTLVFFLCCCGA